MTNPPSLTWNSVPLRFGLHILVGASMFVMVGVAAVGLHIFVGWMSSMEVADWMVGVARAVEYGLFGIDVILFAVYVVRTTIHHGWAMIQGEVT